MKFQPCGSLDILLGQFYYQNISKIYLLDGKLQISRNIHLNFSCHYKVEIKPWRNNSFSTLVCKSDFSMTFSGIKEILIQSTQFKECGKSNPLILVDLSEWLVMLVQVINVTFIQTGQSSLQIISDVHELQVINSTFTGGRNGVDINNTGTVLKVIFRSTTFSHNRIGSVITCGTLEKSFLDIQNCSFSNNVATNFNVYLNSFHSIMFVSTCFEENFANNIIQVENVTIISIVDTIFNSNAVQSGSVLYFISGHSTASIFYFDNNIVRNNTAKLSDNGVLSVKGLQTYIRNSVFQKNEANRSTLTISESSLTVINMTTFEDNQVSLEGGAVSGNAIQNLYIYRCNFTNNSADSGGALRISGESIVIHNSYFNSNIANEHGGALQAHAGMVNTTGSHWFNNTSLRGAGGAISITSDLRETSLKLHSCNFNWNKAHVNGGAVRILSFVALTASGTNFSANSANHGGAIAIHVPHMVILWNCIFFNNTSESKGGAISVSKNGIELIFVADCIFINNTAVASGGAISFEAADHFFALPYLCWNIFDRVNDFINDIYTIMHFNYFSGFNLSPDKSDYYNLTVVTKCFFSHNTVTNQSSTGGAISVRGKHSEYIPHFYQLVIVDCTLIGNSAAVGGGVFCYSSKVCVKNAIFHGNTALYSGGGITLDRSKICFTGNVSFIANNVSHEEGKGGALYSNDSREACEENSCPVLWTNQSSLRFNNNVAKEGAAIFGGMLESCERFPDGSLETAFKRLEFDNMPYNLDSYAITSSAIKLCFGTSCEKIKKCFDLGEVINVTVACLDQLNQPLNNCEVFEYIIFPGGQAINTYKYIISGLYQLSYQWLSRVTISFKLNSNLLCNESKWNGLEVVPNLPLCPLGFYLESYECICDYRLHDILGNIECSIQNELIFTSSGWFSYLDRLLRIHSKCPFNYCQKLRKFISPLEPDNQCAHNRGGVLCGGCLVNYSVVLGSLKCMECSDTSSYNFIWLTVIMALAGVFLVILLMLMKMTVSSGTINGLIFFANIVSFSGLPNHQNCVIHPFLHVFISWINLDLGIEMCFYSGMDVYQKTWLQFVFPFYIWFLVGVIIVVCHYSSTVMKLMGMRNIEVLATPFLLSYAKLLKTIITALSVTNIMVASADNITDPLRPHKVWVYDGNIEYLGSKHLSLFIVAVLFLFILFMPFTLFLLCGQWLQYIPRKRGLRWIHSTFISTIMDAYHAPYTKHHRYWTGLGLLIRCCLFTIFGTSDNARIILMSITTVVILLLVIRVVSTGVLYRNKVVGLLELFYLTNLGILATVLLVSDALCAVITASISLSFIVFVGTFFYHLHQETKRNNSYKRMKSKFYEMIILKKTKTGINVKEDKSLSPKRGTSTSYFELRESLIDSTM